MIIAAEEIHYDGNNQGKPETNSIDLIVKALTSRAADGTNSSKYDFETSPSRKMFSAPDAAIRNIKVE